MNYKFTSIYVNLITNLRQVTSIYISLRQFTSGMTTKLHQFISIYVSLRQIASIYFSLRKFTLIHINLHQFTLISDECPSVYLKFCDDFDIFVIDFGLTLVSLFGITLGSLRNHFGVTLESRWGQFGITLG